MNNENLFQMALNIFPGGVHSPVRSFQHLDRAPHFFSSARGNYLKDVEGKEFVDFCLSFGPLILGHAPKVISIELIEGILNGWSYGTVEPYSLELGSFILNNINIPKIKKIRFMNSGTEAVMSAVRLARGVTKKNLIIKFNGCYHGHSDSMLIKAGSGTHYLSQASSSGVPENVAKDTIVLELDDEQSIKNCFHEYKNSIAALIIEPLPLNSGMLPQRLEFLKFLREITREHQTLLIFDEVYTGFRVSFQGFTGKYGFAPDIICYGKIIGGGLPVGAIASSEEIMNHLAPIGPVYQAGTLSANPLAMIAGLKTIKEMHREQGEKGNKYLILEDQTKNIVSLFKNWLKSNPFPDSNKFEILSQESLFWFYPKENHHPILPRSMKDLPESSFLIHHFKNLFESLFQRGIYISPNPYEVNFTSWAMVEDTQFVHELEKKLYGGN